jgi:N-acetylglucosaminyldiphosphoundecaprenol N-acetyl-beta-D-mannosaminyltransferase
MSLWTAAGRMDFRPRDIEFLGFPVHSVTMDQALSCVAEFAIQPGRCRLLAVINANKVWLAHRNPLLASCLRDADLVVPEYAVVWGAKMLGTPVPQSIRGIELLQKSLDWLEQQQLPVYFLGGRLEVLRRMVARLSRSHPRLPVAGARSGFFSPQEEPSVVAEINAAKPAVVFVGMGSPRQEIWMHSHRLHLRASLVMGVGGSFDVMAGVKKDAPTWTRHGFEWLYRLSQDPRNLWRRYLVTNPWFVYRVVKKKFERVR